MTTISIDDDDGDSCQQAAPSGSESSQSVIKSETSYSYFTPRLQRERVNSCWTLLGVVLVIGYVSEYITERNEILADITAAALSGLPPECMALDATNWLQWIATGPQAQAIERCHRYISIITQSTHPNVLLVAMNLAAKVFVLPVTLVIESMSKCLSFFLDQFSYTTGLILIVFTMTFTLVLIMGLCMLCKHTSNGSYDQMQYRKWLMHQQQQQQSSIAYPFEDVEFGLCYRNLGIASSTDTQDIVHRKRVSPQHHSSSSPSTTTAGVSNLPIIEEV